MKRPNVTSVICRRRAIKHYSRMDFVKMFADARAKMSFGRKINLWFMQQYHGVRLKLNI